MATTFRVKRSFTAGELSPLMGARDDFDRFKNGCRELTNMVVLPQGPVTRRAGMQFIYSLNDLGIDVNNPQVREIPFIFNEEQAYAFIFFRHTGGTVKLVFGTGEGLVAETATLPSECPPGTPYTPSAGAIVSIDFGANFDIENFDYVQSGDEVYFSYAGEAQKLLVRHNHYCWELSTIGFTDAPSEWNATEGYPERVVIHQQRLGFMSNLTGRQTVWLSKAGSFFDFGASSPAVAADSVTFTLDSGTQNKIVWGMSHKSLHIGTIGSEWTVSGVNGQNALTADNPFAQRQSNTGSEAMKALMVGFTTLFVERHGKTINEFVYDYQYDNYKSNPLTILAPHLTESNYIVDWTYQQVPDSVLWCVRDDGDLIALTYQRENKVVGWHRHETDGNFKAITCIPGENREDDVWCVVQRTIEGSVKYYIEKFVEAFKGTTAEEGRFLDSHLVYEGAPTATITGLDHLEGKEVSILAGGFVLPNQVVASGEVQLGAEYTPVVVGLAYESLVSPYLGEVRLKDGTSYGRFSRTDKLTVDLYRSLGMLYVQYDDMDEDQEEEIIFREPWENVEEQTALFTGSKHLDGMEGVTDETNYAIVQRKPLPLTVRAVVDSVEVFR